MNDNKKTIVFAAGGTGGHIFPALTVARRFLDLSKDTKVLFVGGGGELEKRLMSTSGFDYEAVQSTGVVGKGFSGILKFVKNFIFGFSKLSKLYKQRNVKLVIGFGGYPTVIPVLVAVLRRTPILIFEQNGIPGVANKFLATFAAKIFMVPTSLKIENSFKSRKNVQTILNPVRPDIKAVKGWSPRLEGQPLKILVIGGSQGAKSLNESILNLKDFFYEHSIELVHQTGKADFEKFREAYKDNISLKAFEFIEDMPAALDAADLIICRAGAGTVSEITYLRIPTIFVPLPISKEHQKFNVLHLVEGKAAKMYPQNESLSENLKSFILEVNKDREILKSMNLSFSKVPELSGVEDGSTILSEEIYSQISKQRNG